MRIKILAALAAVALLLTGVACDKKSPTGPGDEPKYSLALLTVEVRNIKDDKPVSGGGSARTRCTKFRKVEGCDAGATADCAWGD
jgi:hypothetical protein